MATVTLTPEEEGWVKAAAAAAGGINLTAIPLNNESMLDKVYTALDITEISPQSRLCALIGKLQTQQQQQQANEANGENIFQRHKRAMATVTLTPEEEGWVKAAADADEGKGFPLEAVDLDDMQEVYDALKVTGLAKLRLRALIGKLQTQQQQQANEANGENIFRFRSFVSC